MLRQVSHRTLAILRPSRCSRQNLRTNQLRPRHSSSSTQPKPNGKPTQPNGFLRSLLPDPAALIRGTFSGLFLLLSGHVFIRYFYSLTACEGISMLPSFNSFGDWVVTSKYYRRGRGVQVGDVVSFQHPVESETKAIKRVLGLPGDLVCRDTPGIGEKMIQVPEGHCWVVGDNLKHSRDSRLFGPLPLALIRGKVIWRFSTSPHYSWPEYVRSTLHAVVEDDGVD